MLVIGLGNHKGCSAVHEETPEQFAAIIEETASLILEKAPIGFCTPPYGIDLFVAQKISGVKMGQMLKYMWWFILALVIVLMLTTYWTPFTMFLLP